MQQVARQVKLQAYQTLKQMAAFSKVGLPVSQVIQDATNGTDFEMMQAALESVSYLSKKEQLQILH